VIHKANRVGKDFYFTFPLIAMEEKIVDSKGRVYLGKWYANKRIYIVDLGGVIVLTPYTAFAEELGKIKSVEELMEFLKSISPKELREAFREAVWEKTKS